MVTIESCYVCIYGVLVFTVFGIHSSVENGNDTITTVRISLPPDLISVNSELSQDPRPLVTESVLIRSTDFKNIVRTDGFTKETTPPSNIVSSCHAFMDEFSEAAANFTKCAVLYARPIKMCEQCYPVYQRAIAIYDIMMKGNVTDGDGVRCGETILNADRVQIVVTTAMFIDVMWSNSSCDNCYMRGNDTDAVVYKLNDLTKKFKALVENTFECFHNSTHQCSTPCNVSTTTSGLLQELIHHGGWNVEGHFTPYQPPKEVNGSVCNDCRAIYQDLNDLYKSLEKEYPKHVCMDLVDSMNITRLIWSRDFRCTRLHGNVAGVMVLSFFFCTLPFAFYIGSRVRGTAVHRKLLKQKRLKNVASVPDMMCPEQDIPATELSNNDSATS